MTVKAAFYCADLVRAKYEAEAWQAGRKFIMAMLVQHANYPLQKILVQHHGMLNSKPHWKVELHFEGNFDAMLAKARAA